jgi:branched-chain amino acid transport system substrate-binding protein
MLLVGLLVVTTLWGFGGSFEGDPKLIKIVSSLPRTGSAKAQTDTIVNGIKIALDEAGYKAGKIEIEYADWDDATAGAGKWTAEAETANAARAVRDPDVMVYIGTYNSGAAKISMPILNKARLLMVSPANTWPGLTKPDKGDPGEPAIYRPTGEVNYLRMVPTDDLQARWAPPQGTGRQAGTCRRQRGNGKGIANLFIEACRLGIEVLGQESTTPGPEFSRWQPRSGSESRLVFGGTTQTKTDRQTWWPPACAAN